MGRPGDIGCQYGERKAMAVGVQSRARGKADREGDGFAHLVICNRLVEDLACASYACRGQDFRRRLKCHSS